MKINIAVRYPELNTNNAFWKKSKIDKSGRMVTQLNASTFTRVVDPETVMYLANTPTDQVCELVNITRFLMDLLDRYRKDIKYTEKNNSSAMDYLAACEQIGMLIELISTLRFCTPISTDKFISYIKNFNEVVKSRHGISGIKIYITVKK